MARVFLLFAILLLIAGFPLHSQDSYLVRNVTVIPMDKEQTLQGQTVIIRNGKIESISSKTSAKPGGNMIVIDGMGKFLLPGFLRHACPFLL